jgi:hypothetical protein
MDRFNTQIHHNLSYENWEIGSAHIQNTLHAKYLKSGSHFVNTLILRMSKKKTWSSVGWEQRVWVDFQDFNRYIWKFHWLGRLTFSDESFYKFWQGSLDEASAYPKFWSYTGQHTAYIDADKHTCLERDSNPSFRVVTDHKRNLDQCPIYIYVKIIVTLW